jgi:hypothetical protein
MGGSRINSRAAGYKHGFRSGLEEKIHASLQGRGVPCEYEPFAIGYITPAKPHKYTPDFVLPNGIIIETKGRFLTADRMKHLLVRQQHPELDIRFVFTNSRARISKNSHTTLGAWCEKHGFKYADKDVPQEWLVEPKKE